MMSYITVLNNDESCMRNYCVKSLTDQIKQEIYSKVCAQKINFSMSLILKDCMKSDYFAKFFMDCGSLYNCWALPRLQTAEFCIEIKCKNVECCSFFINF